MITTFRRLQQEDRVWGQPELYNETLFKKTRGVK